MKNNLSLNKIENYYCNLGDLDGCDKIIDYIKKIELKESNLKDKYQNKFFYLILLIKKMISDFIGKISDKDATKIAKSKRGHYDEKIISEKLKIVDEIEDLKSFRIKKIFPGVLLFDK